MALIFPAINAFSQKADFENAMKLIEKKKNYAEAGRIIEPFLNDSAYSGNAELKYMAGRINMAEFDDNKFILERDPRNSKVDPLSSAKKLISGYDLLRDALKYSSSSANPLSEKRIKEGKSLINNHHSDYLEAGNIFYQEKDYPSAFRSFMLYSSLPEDEIADRHVKATSDSLINIGYFNAALAAFADKDVDSTLKAFSYNDSPSGVDSTKISLQLSSFLAKLDEKTIHSDTLTSNRIHNEIEKLSYKGLESFGDKIPGFLNVYIISLASAGKGQLAHEAVDSLLSKQPADARLLALKGYLYDIDGEDDKSIESYKKAAAVRGVSADILKRTALKCYKVGSKRLKECEEGDVTGKEKIKDDLILYAQKTAFKAYKEKPSDEEIGKIRDMIDYSVERFYQ